MTTLLYVVALSHLLSIGEKRYSGYLMMKTDGQFLSVFHKNILCGYSLESPNRGDR